MINIEQITQLIKDYGASVLSAISVGGIVGVGATVAKIITSIKTSFTEVKGKLNDTTKENTDIKNQLTQVIADNKELKKQNSELLTEITKIKHEE